MTAAAVALRAAFNPRLELGHVYTIPTYNRF